MDAPLWRPLAASFWPPKESDAMSIEPDRGPIGGQPTRASGEERRNELIASSEELIRSPGHRHRKRSRLVCLHILFDFIDFVY